ncbi:MAG: 4Fe-4S binding protein [Planctomycetota bacterium]|jgi:electron transport complex protein RnfB
MQGNKDNVSRRKFLRNGLRGASVAALGAAAGLFGAKNKKAVTVWQIDPNTCVACGNCATYCVLEESAVKCVHAYAICGYCQLCTGYFPPNATTLDTGAENQLCPTGAIKRTFVEDPYYEYTIDESLCIGCGKCVKGCNAFGNGSLFLQVRHDRCLNCNECSIAVACPSGAYERISADSPYLLKETGHT